VIIFLCKCNISSLLIALCKVGERFYTFRFIFKILVINRYGLLKTVEVTEDVSLIEKCESILVIYDKGIVISLEGFLVLFKLIIYYSEVIPCAVRKWFS
jgi:hypothetical protein